jgi:hypothetical protein
MTSTAVTRPSDDPSGVGLLPPEIRQALELRKTMNLAAAELARTSWGKALDVPTRRAIADFGQKFNIDTATEIYVLGGNVYVNGAFYLRKLSELIEAGRIIYAVADMIHVDPRLEEMADAGDERAIAERTRRKFERIKFDVDDSAISACVVRIKPREIDVEVTGCKAIYDDKTSEGKYKDPIGNNFPMETVETRAYRRAMRKLASHIPAVADDVEKMERAAAVLSRSVQEFRERQDALGLSERVEEPLQISPGLSIKPGGGGKLLASQGDELPLRPGEIRYVDADGITVTRKATAEELTSVPLNEESIEIPLDQIGQSAAAIPEDEASREAEVSCDCPGAPASHLASCWRSKLDPPPRARSAGEPAPLHTKKTEAARKAKLAEREPGEEE